jgi:hypothetical protein
MRFIIMHKTNAHWEAGAIPGKELIGRVGALLGQIAKAGALLAAEGLGPSSEGVRIKFTAGKRIVVNGPFERGNELPAGFSIVRAQSIDDAIEWASRQAGILGDGEVDIRPVTEPWDLGMRPRPAGATRRYMVLRKATAATESGATPSSAEQAKLSRLLDETTRAGVHLGTETMRPSERGRRYKNSRDGISVVDGPFIESKELVGGYVVVSAESLDDACRWADAYIAVVEADEVDVRELL